MLTSFEVHGFRAFSQLTIERLGRVNLIVGKNNSGKSSLLEALRVYRTAGSPFVLGEILRAHDEVLNPSDMGLEVAQLAALFHGRNPRPFSDKISLGPKSAPQQRLVLRPVFVRDGLNPIRSQPAGTSEEVTEEAAAADPNVRAALSIELGGREMCVDADMISGRRSRMTGLGQGPTWISATGADNELVSRWWDVIVLNPESENRVVKCLRPIAPVERMTLVERPERRGRMFMVRLKGETGSTPLRSFGDGMARMFQIAIAMEFASRTGFVWAWMSQWSIGESLPLAPTLLLDEAENGIHYSVLADFWRFVFKVAQQNGVQVFATSHSWDCIEGFQVAASENSAADGVLIRLERHDQGTKAVLFDADELRIVSRDEIEVR